MNSHLIAVIGSGTMGGGIALACARAGFSVLLYDVSEKILADAMARIQKELARNVENGKITSIDAESAIERMTTVTAFEDLRSATFVIEAAPEKLELKKSIFQNLEKVCAPRTIFATNTSSLSVTAIAASVQLRERVVGMHFFNPPTVMKLVEVVQGHFTGETQMVETIELARAIGKTPVRVKDTPAFIVNRIARPFYGEAFRILDDQTATIESVDRIVRSHGFRMGPFELMDLIGIDVNYDVTCAVYDMFFGEPRFRPHPIQRKMVEANLLGRKTGKGFYDYTKK